MGAYTFRTSDGVSSLDGDLIAKSGAPGDVPTQQANGQLAQAPGGGGSMPGQLASKDFLFTEHGDARREVGVLLHELGIGDRGVDHHDRVMIGALRDDLPEQFGNGRGGFVGAH